MKSNHVGPVKVALFGMDTRSYKTLQLFLKGPCRGIAEVVDESLADIDILDADFAYAGEILESRRQQSPQRPIILLSLQRLAIENTHYVPKPVNSQQLTTMICQLAGPKRKQPSNSVNQDAQSTAQKPVSNSVGQDEQIPVQKTRQRRSAFEDNEGGFTTFLGTLLDIDFSDPTQLQKASFEPKNYLLGYVLSALKVSAHQGTAQQLNSIWKPLLIFPKTRQIWLDADDKQLRAFAGIEQSKMYAGNIGLVPLDAAVVSLAENDSQKFQDMDAFVWKLALWTSKGRFPLDIDPVLPVYLKHWPNFTRLMLIPDALRMAALIIENPRSPMDIAKVLQVKPHYVFAFITACQSLGILDQARRQSDLIVMPEPPSPTKKQGLFSKILQKLRGDQVT